MPIEIPEFMLSINKDKIVYDYSKTLYLQMVGSLLFAAIAIWPNLAFVDSQLFRFNQQLGHKHHKTAN